MFDFILFRVIYIQVQFFFMLLLERLQITKKQRITTKVQGMGCTKTMALRKGVKFVREEMPDFLLR